jgi:hypothetical protein
MKRKENSTITTDSKKMDSRDQQSAEFHAFAWFLQAVGRTVIHVRLPVYYVTPFLIVIH